MFSNKILSHKNQKIILTKGIEGIEIGEVNIKAVQKFKCPLVTIDTDDYEYNETMFEADPGKYIIELK
jgi:hypothetical protein